MLTYVVRPEHVGALAAPAPGAPAGLLGMIADMAAAAELGTECPLLPPPSQVCDFLPPPSPPERRDQAPIAPSHSYTLCCALSARSRANESPRSLLSLSLSARLPRCQASSKENFELKRLVLHLVARFARSPAAAPLLVRSRLLPALSTYLEAPPSPPHIARLGYTSTQLDELCTAVSCVVRQSGFQYCCLAAEGLRNG